MIKCMKTQYLHMSRLGESFRYAGSLGTDHGILGQSGLATGPHVCCFRFWKNV